MQSMVISIFSSFLVNLNLRKSLPIDKNEAGTSCQIYKRQKVNRNPRVTWSLSKNLKKTNEYLNDESIVAGDFLEAFYTDPSVCPWQGKRIGVESSEVTEKKDEGTRNSTGGEESFRPLASERPLSRRSSPDESSSTRPTRFAEHNRLSSPLRLLLTRLPTSRLFHEFFFPEPSKKRRNKRENIVHRQGNRFKNRFLGVHSVHTLPFLCLHCCNAACNPLVEKKKEKTPQ